ncbi:MAG: hypothetical protein Q4E65_01860 [Clostridia bacterium]|nr:hypothetical protein [Clostridia bacterium]
MKEFFRKELVNLKRMPQRIPLALLCISCIVYTFHLTAHSNASMYVASNIVALYVFIITLASMLSIISHINAYAGGKRHMAMFIITILLVVLQLLLDALYLQDMFHETVYRPDPVPITPDIAGSMNNTMAHMGCLAVSLLAILLQPVYHKALLKIDTSTMDVEESDIHDDTTIDEEFPDEDDVEFDE